MKKVLVIDDHTTAKGIIEKWSEGRMAVSHLWRIPDDLSILKDYDALVVDGQGIGNKAFHNGMELLMSYEKPEGQSVVYYSGNGAYGEEKKELEKRGVAAVTKGSNPEKLILAIEFAMEKKNEKEETCI